MKRFRVIGVITLTLGIFAFSFQPVRAEGSGLTSVQIQAILSLLSSFGASASVVSNVETALNGGTPSSASPASSGSQSSSSGETTSSALTVLSPQSGASFAQGQPITISWSGGAGKVQLGLIDGRYETNAKVLGWISLNEKSSGSFTWDGETIFDITGTVGQSVSALSGGPFKIIAVSSGSNGAFCVEKNKGCNYALSGGYFPIRFAQKLQDLSVSCSPTASSVQTGDSVTWQATTTNGVAPFVYSWNGTDGISALPARSTDSRFLDVRYLNTTPKTKIAEVTVRDATGKQGFASCSSAIEVSQAPSPVVVSVPAGGESFIMTNTTDPSQAMLVSWKLNGSSRYGKEPVKIALQDTWGRTCIVGSAPRVGTTAFAGLVNGFPCPSAGFSLSPGQYRVKVYVEGKESTISGMSNGSVTLLPPVADPQSITPSVSVINTGESVKYRFVFPSNTVKNSLYLSCPAEVTSVPANSCNKYTNLPLTSASSTEFTATFTNTSSKTQKVTANFYVYLPNNPNFGRGVSTEVSVLPASTGSDSLVSVMAPNGGETIYYGKPFIYRFSAMKAGVVDLTLVPYPPIDAGLICQIATGTPASLGQLSFTIPAGGTCAKGPAKLISGDYRLFATLRDGNTKIATDLSDSFFTVRASSSTTPAN